MLLENTTTKVVLFPPQREPTRPRARPYPSLRMPSVCSESSFSNTAVASIAAGTQSGVASNQEAEGSIHERTYLHVLHNRQAGVSSRKLRREVGEPARELVTVGKLSCNVGQNICCCCRCSIMEGRQSRLRHERLQDLVLLRIGVEWGVAPNGGGQSDADCYYEVTTTERAPPDNCACRTSKGCRNDCTK